jgi:hypothetical protein
VNLDQRNDFYSLLASTTRSPEIPESDDVYGWLCGSWDLDVRCYRGVNVAGQGLQGEVHAARVLEGRAVQDVWIMPRSDQRQSDSDRAMNMYGTTLRSWDPTSQSWHIGWTNPVRGHREEQVGRWNGRDILQEGTRPDGTKTRWTFTEITAQSFTGAARPCIQTSQHGLSRRSFSRHAGDMIRSRIRIEERARH